MATLNSNPEILLRKRKNNERKRIEKQEQARIRQAEHKKRNLLKNKKFIRAETLVSNFKSAELEAKRIKHITKHEQQKQSISQEKEDDDDVDSKLLFIVRVPDHTKGLKIPSKARKVLNLLRLKKSNTGVFVKVTPTTIPILKIISPYILAGKPSLNSIRKLFQKRACISAIDEETSEPRIVKLDNNAVVEEKFGEEFGYICIEDLIHEIVTMGADFKTISNWLMPFKLNVPVSGWGPQAKLAKLQYAADNQRKVSLAGDAKLTEIDIDSVIDEQN
ncbi:ribosome biogenesis protein Rlp7p [[Candida] railenensis]|uniref:Ribosome biogenesis protein Rlp7p n=1 Tax=[Candida] railenensis TaxID=45579 RepID=A0A9P0QKC1_9ASCO|nr:ribosome biogenesis protein Rlp7p [[Candida] railenensis]